MKKFKIFVIYIALNVIFFSSVTFCGDVFASNRYEGRDVKMIRLGPRRPYLFEMYIRGRIQTVKGLFYAISSSGKVLGYTN